jgi:hypothetical protein
MFPKSSYPLSRPLNPPKGDLKEEMGNWTDLTFKSPPAGDFGGAGQEDYWDGNHQIE